MFQGKLYENPDDEAPARLYVFDPAVGRRVPVELKMVGQGVFAEPIDVPEFEEPPLGRGNVDPAGRDVPDVRRAPIDIDDFEHREPDPAGAPASE